MPLSFISFAYRSSYSSLTVNVGSKAFDKEERCDVRHVEVVEQDCLIELQFLSEDLSKMRIRPCGILDLPRWRSGLSTNVRCVREGASRSGHLQDTRAAATA